METLIIYWLKANIIISVLFLVYYAFFRRLKFLIVNRLLLLAILAAAFIIPLCPAIPDSQLNNKSLSLLSLNQLGQLPDQSKVIKEEHSSVPTLDFSTIYQNSITGLTMAYLAVSLMLLIRFLVHLRRLFNVIRKSTKKKGDGLIYCEPCTLSNTPPFSFFKFIVVKRTDFKPEVYEQILAHEVAHCQQLHSIDLLLAELACIVLWSNPVVFLYKRQVKLNLEFLADEQVLHAGILSKDYQLNLVGIAIKAPEYTLANSFHSSRIKQRIMMMNNKRPPMLNSFRYIMLLPLVVALYLLVDPLQAKPKGPVTWATLEKEIKPLAMPGATGSEKHLTSKPKSIQQKKFFAIAMPVPVTITADTAKKPKNRVSLTSSTEKESLVKNTHEIVPDKPKQEVIEVTLIPPSNYTDFENKLILIDGKEVSEDEMKKISVGSIQSIVPYKYEDYKQQYGEKAKNGVVWISLKKDK